MKNNQWHTITPECVISFMTLWKLRGFSVAIDDREGTKFYQLIRYGRNMYLINESFILNKWEIISICPDLHRIDYVKLEDIVEIKKHLHKIFKEGVKNARKLQTSSAVSAAS